MLAKQYVYIKKIIDTGNLRIAQRLFREDLLQNIQVDMETSQKDKETVQSVLGSNAKLPKTQKVYAFVYALKTGKYEIADLIITRIKQSILETSIDCINEFINDIEALKILLKHGAKVSTYDVENAKDYDTCELLLDHYTGSLANFTDQDGNIVANFGNSEAITEAIALRNTLLTLLTTSSDSKQELEAFIKAHPTCINWQLDLTSVADYDYARETLMRLTPLQIAAMQGKHIDIDALLENGADINDAAQVIDIRYENEDCFKYDNMVHACRMICPQFLTHPDSNFTLLVDFDVLAQANKTKWSTLFFQLRDLNNISTFLEQNPEAVDWSIIDELTNASIKPIHWAIQKDNIDLFTLLLNKGAKIDIKCFELVCHSDHDTNKDAMIKALLNSPNFKPEYLSPQRANNLVYSQGISLETTKLILEKTNIRIQHRLVTYEEHEKEKSNFIKAKYEAQCRSDYFEDMVLYADSKTQALNVFTIIAPIAITYIASQISESYGPLVATASGLTIAYINKDNNIQTHASFFALETMAMTAISYGIQSDDMAIQIAFGVAAAASMALAVQNTNATAKEYNFTTLSNF